MEKEENQNTTPTDKNQNLEKETEKPEESSGFSVSFSKF